MNFTKFKQTGDRTFESEVFLTEKDQPLYELEPASDAGIPEEFYTSLLVFTLFMFSTLYYLSFDSRVENPIYHVEETVTYVSNEISKTKEADIPPIAEPAAEELVDTVKVTPPQTINEFAPIDVTVLEMDPGVKAFVDRWSPVAVSEMNKYDIPASITLAQGLIESRIGNSKLAVENNNYFGMKCFSKKCSKGHCTNYFDDGHKDFFRKYSSAWESWRDHSKLIAYRRNGAGRYAHCFKSKNYKEWAKRLKQCGYATDKNYATKLIKCIEKYHLYKFDEL